MPIVTPRVPRSPRDVLLIAAALLPLAGASFGMVHAAPGPLPEPLAFAVPTEDGYGIDACMQGGSTCGQAVANAFCEAHGHVKAVAFGTADVTGSTGGATTQTAHDGDLMIRCGD